MEKIKKFFANKMVITGLIIAVILFVLYSNKDKIKAWFEPDAASDKPKESGKDDKPATNNATPPATNPPAAATPPAVDYTKTMEYKSSPMQGNEVKVLQKMLNREIAQMKSTPLPDPSKNQLDAVGLPQDAQLTVDGIFGTKTADYLKKIAGVEKTSLVQLASNTRIKATNIISLYLITPN